METFLCKTRKKQKKRKNYCVWDEIKQQQQQEKKKRKKENDALQKIRNLSSHTAWPDVLTLMKPTKDKTVSIADEGSD